MTIEQSADTTRAVALAARAAVHAALADEHRLAVVDQLRLSDRTPGELAEATGTATNLLAHHLGVLEGVGLVARGRSQGDGRRRYVRLLVEPELLLAHHGGPVARHVLFVCTRNASRSQLAAALWTARTGRPASSAGSAPADRVDEGALAVAALHGLDLAGARPAGLDEAPEDVDLVVSVCDRAHESGPSSDRPRLHWSVADPHGAGPAAHARAFDELTSRVDRLARQVAA